MAFHVCLSLFSVAITEYLRLKKINFFLKVLETVKSKVKWPNW